MKSLQELREKILEKILGEISLRIPKGICRKIPTAIFEIFWKKILLNISGAFSGRISERIHGRVFLGNSRKLEGSIILSIPEKTLEEVRKKIF